MTNKKCTKCNGIGYHIGGCDRSGTPVQYKCSTCNGTGLTK